MTKDELILDPEYQFIVGQIDANVDYVNENTFSKSRIDLVLNQAVAGFGVTAANDLIDEFNLTQFGWSRFQLEDYI